MSKRNLTEQEKNMRTTSRNCGKIRDLELKVRELEHFQSFAKGKLLRQTKIIEEFQQTEKYLRTIYERVVRSCCEVGDRPWKDEGGIMIFPDGEDHGTFKRYVTPTFIRTHPGEPIMSPVTGGKVQHKSAATVPRNVAAGGDCSEQEGKQCDSEEHDGGREKEVEEKKVVEEKKEEEAVVSRGFCLGQSTMSAHVMKVLSRRDASIIDNLRRTISI